MVKGLESKSSTLNLQAANNANYPVFEKGQLKVAVYMNFGLLTVHIIQGRQLFSKLKHNCDSYVKLSLTPNEDSKRTKCKTQVIKETNNPLYDEKFSFELLEEDHNKRLVVSIWHKDKSGSEFLGCMSFGVKHLINPSKEVSGWYYLLTEHVGKKKHLKVSSRQTPQLKPNTDSNIPVINKDVWWMEPMTLTLTRGKRGFGFSVVESCPVKVGRVDGASPAEEAGLKPDDCVIRVNNQNISRSTAISVAKLVKNSGTKLVLDIQRAKKVPAETLEKLPMKQNVMCFTDKPSTNDADSSDEQSGDESRDNEFSVDEDLFLRNARDLPTSTPLPLFCFGHQTVRTSERQKQEAVFRLLDIEMDFVDVMHSGMQRFSRPLRHCIMSQYQHAVLFQNIEKLVNLSEYHIQQMQDLLPSHASDTDTSNSSDGSHFSVSASIGLIYRSKVNMLCQNYELFARGLSDANSVLSDLRKNPEFLQFIKNPPLEGKQPSVFTFVNRPNQHIRELYQALRDVYINTPSGSDDYYKLKEVVEALQELVNNITNFSVGRVDSVSSLDSRDSRSSVYSSGYSYTSSQSGYSSAASDGALPPMNSLKSLRSVDMEVVKIQDKLLFSDKIKMFSLAQDDRHLIYSGDLFKWEGKNWAKLYVMLFTDMFLQTEKDGNGKFVVIHEPLSIMDLNGVELSKDHPTELIFHTKATHPVTGQPGNRKMLFCAPSTEQKYAWKSLLEQRVRAIKGHVDIYGGSDTSGSSVVI